MIEKCPNVNLPEWKVLVNSIGEDEAYRVFIANNEEVPTYEEVLNFLNKNLVYAEDDIQSEDLEKQGYKYIGNLDTERGNLPAYVLNNNISNNKISFDNILLSPEHTTHYINVASGLLDDNYIAREKKGLKILELDAIKKGFIDSFQTYINTICVESKKQINQEFLNEISKENSVLWEEIKDDRNRKYYVKEDNYEDAEEQKTKTANFDEIQESSTVNSVLDIIKRSINRLKKREPITLNANGTVSETLSNPILDTISGLPERLEYKDYAGGLFLHYLGCETLNDILERTKTISKFHSSFMELHQMFLDDSELLTAFYTNILRQAKQASVILVSGSVVTSKLEGKTFAQKLGDSFNGVVFNLIKSTDYYNEDLKNALNSEALQLKKVVKNKEQLVTKTEAIERISKTLELLKIEVKEEDIINLFRLHKTEDVIKQFNTVFNSLINTTNSLFTQSINYKVLNNKKLALNAELKKLAESSKSNKVYYEKDKEIKLNNKEIKKFKFDNVGNLFTIATLISTVRIDQPDTVTISVHGKQKSTIQWNDYISNFFNVLKNNPKEGLENLLDAIGYDRATKEIGLPDVYLSNIFFGKNGLLKRLTENTSEGQIGDIVLNKEVVNVFDYHEDGGIKNTLTNDAAEWDEFNEQDLKYKQLYYHAKKKASEANLTSQHLPTSADSKSIKIITLPKWEVPADELTNIQDINLTVKTDWFGAIWSTVKQEINKMEVAGKIMFEYETDKKGNFTEFKKDDKGSYILKKDLPPLLLNYHYTLNKSTGKPEYLKNGKPTGNVFKFSNFLYKENGVEKTLNNITDGDIITEKDIVRDGKSTGLGVDLIKETYKFVKWHIAEHVEYYKDCEINFDKDVKATQGVFSKIVAELAINNYLTKIAMQDLFGDSLKDVGKLVNVFKRAKKSPGAAFTIYEDKRKEGYMVLEVDDIIKSILLNSKTGKTLLDVNTTDGISLITREEKLRRLRRLGKHKAYNKALEAFNSGDFSVIDNIVLEQDKNFYYDNKFDNDLQIRVAELVKNSDVNLNAESFKGTQLEDLVTFIQQLEKETGQGVQLVFKSALKKGNKNNIITLHDENGDLLPLTDTLKTKIKSSLRQHYYKNLVKVQDTKVNIKDHTQLLGTQFVKSIITNLNNTISYSNGRTGEDLIKELFNTIDANLKEAFVKLTDELKDKEGQITEVSLAKVVKELGKDIDKNLLKALEDAGIGRTVMPFDYSVFSDKIQELLTSLWTNNITKQRHAGYHAFQAPSLFLNNRTKDGKKIKLSDNSQSTYTGNIQWLKRKEKDTQLKCIELVKGKVLKMEVLVSRWDSRFINKNKPININDLDPDILTSIGFRIPTEGKFSTFVFDVVGFLPENMAGTMIVPDGFTGITGSDYDIDSIYVMVKNLDANLKAVKFLDETVPIQQRYHVYNTYTRGLSILKERKADRKALKEVTKKANFDFYKENVKESEIEYLNWFNKQFNQNLEAFYQIKNTFNRLIEEIEESFDLNLIQLNNPNNSGMEKQLTVLLDTKLREELQVLLDAKTAFEENFKSAILLDEDKIKSYEEKLRQEEENYLNNSNFNSKSIEEQNIRAARENKIFSIYEEILTHPDNFDEVTSPSEYADITEATEEVNKLVETYNPNILKHSNKLTANILRNKVLKGNAVNFSNLVQISNVAKFSSEIPVMYKASKEEIEMGMSSISNLFHMGVLKTNEGWSDKNLKGEFITNYVAKTVANIMDAVANPMAPNLNEYTLNVFSLFPAFGVPNYKYSTYFISQGVITELIKEVDKKGIFSESIDDSEITIIENKIHTIIRLLHYSILSEEKQQAFLVKLGNATNGIIDDFTYSEKQENLKLIGEVQELFDYNELLDEIKYFNNNQDVFNIVDKYLDGNPNLATDNAQKDKEYLAKQLNILEQFKTYKKLGKDLVSFSQLLTVDKKGAGPQIDINKKLLDDIDAAGLNEKYQFKVNGSNAIVKVYPSFFGLNQPSVYKHLESKLKYSNQNSYEVLADFFITETPHLRSLINQYQLDWQREGIKKEISRHLLLDVDFFKESRATRKQILGVEIPFVADLDLTNDADEIKEIYNSLSTANQLFLVQLHFNKLFDRNVDGHLLNELSFDDRTLDTEEYKYKAISRKNLNDTEKFSYQMGLMLSSDNDYISTLAKNLIRYTYFTTGWTYGNNLASVVPMDFITKEQGKRLGLDIDGTLRNAKLEANQGVIVIGDIASKYHRKNWKNNKLVPEVSVKLLYNKEEDSYTVKAKTPNWSERGGEFLYISKEDMKYIKNPTIKNAKFVKRKQPDFTFKVYEREILIGLEDGEEVEIGYMYKIVNKIETWEDSDVSLIEENNSPSLDLEKYNNFKLNVVNNFYKVLDAKKESDENNTSYDNIIHDTDTTQTDAQKLVSSTRKATERILKIVDTFAFYGSFNAKSTIKSLISKPVADYKEEELENLYYRIAFANRTVFEDLGISSKGGFHSKDIEEKRRIVANLINKYKKNIEKTKEGISNKIRIPLKLTKDLTEKELLYNVSVIVEHIVNRVDYTQKQINKWNEGKGEFALGDVYNLKEINEFSRLVNHINSIKDIMLELDSIRWVNQGEGLNETQVAINYLILTANEYRDQFNKISTDAHRQYSKYIKGVIAQTTTNPEFLKDTDDMSKAIEKAIESMRDSTSAQLLLDAPKDSTNPILANLIQKWNTQKEMENDKANLLIQEFAEIMKDVTDYSEIFQLSKSGKNLGRLKDIRFIKGYANQKLVQFLIDKVGLISTDTNPNNIVEQGYLPALAILNKSNWKIIKEKLGYFDSFDRNVKEVTDVEGNRLKSVTQLYTNFIKPKAQINILNRVSGESLIDYNTRLVESVLLSTGLSFKDKKQIEEYNQQVIQYNKMLNSVSHAENISYDLNNIIPLYIREAHSFNWKKLIENEFLMNIRVLSGMDFEIKRNTIDTLTRRYTGVNKNVARKGKASNILKQLELWGHINIYNDFNEDSAKVTKWGRVLQQYTSYVGLGLNPFSGLNNVIYGSIQNRIASVADGHFSIKHNTMAGKLYYSFDALSSYFLDKTDVLESLTLQSALIKDLDIMNVQTEEVERTKTDVSANSFEGTAGTALNSLFFFQHAGEHMMQNRLLFALMYGAKVIDGRILTWKQYLKEEIETGKISDDLETLKEKYGKNKKALKDLKDKFDSHKSLIDCYEFKNGFAVRSAEISTQEIAKFKVFARNMGQRLHGIYTKEDMNYMQKWVVGRWAMQFKRWMRPGWNKRFGSRFLQDAGYMESYQERDKGSFTTLLQFVATPIRQANEQERKFGLFYMSYIQLIGDYKNFILNANIYWGTMSLEDKAKVKQATLEIALFVSTILVLSMSRKIDDDDKELRDSYLFAFYLNQLDRLKSEVGGYQPFSIGGSGGWYNEGKKLMSSPSATTSKGIELIQLMFEITSLINGAGEDEYFQRGIYSKTLKAQVHLLRAIPILNQAQRYYYLPENNQYYKLYQ